MFVLLLRFILFWVALGCSRVPPLGQLQNNWINSRKGCGWSEKSYAKQSFIIFVVCPQTPSLRPTQTLLALIEFRFGLENCFPGRPESEWRSGKMWIRIILSPAKLRWVDLIMLLPTPRNSELELWDEAAVSLEKLLETMLKKGNSSFLCIHHVYLDPACLPAPAWKDSFEQNWGLGSRRRNW